MCVHRKRHDWRDPERRPSQAKKAARVGRKGPARTAIRYTYIVASYQLQRSQISVFLGASSSWESNDRQPSDCLYQPNCNKSMQVELSLGPFDADSIKLCLKL